MCRNIKTLFNFDPPVTDEEIRAASVQFVRKISGFNKPSRANEASFLAAVDEVLKDMSEITGWQLKGSLKKSFRSRQQIRAYVLQQMNDEKDAKERYASAKTAEAFASSSARRGSMARGSRSVRACSFR